MEVKNVDKSTVDIAKAVVDVLAKYVPPKKNSKHLEDIISMLMHALMNNKLSISIDGKSRPLVDIKGSGWPDSHHKALFSSGWLKGDLSPMVLEGHQLSWRRWHCEINETIQELIERSKINSTSTEKLSSKISKNKVSNLNKEQKSAVNSVHKNNIILLSGGPGTGKTSTILQMLIQILTVKPNSKIGLAAPTGKATRRLQETLQRNSSDIDVQYKEKISHIQCRTLHSWLEARPGSFGKNKSSPLKLDLLVIDEMSMVDLGLMQGVLEALPRKTKLILVGDPSQLPPIGSGAIWEELQSKNIRNQFSKGAIHLHKVYRNRGGIAHLAKIIRDEGTESFWKSLINEKDSSNVRSYSYTSSSLPTKVLSRIESHKKTLKKLVKILMHEISKEINASSKTDIKETETIEKLFYCLNNLMILCPRKNGLWGVNQIHHAVLGKNLEAGVCEWPEGTPIICSNNQPELGLSNGDIGVVIGKKKDRRLLFRILSDNQRLVSRLIHPSRLKKIDPSFALTIHKAQGSEANTVIVLWPSKIKEPSQELKESKTRDPLDQKLIYTAITRAKEKLELNVIHN